jgi:hypothetical protein
VTTAALTSFGHQPAAEAQVATVSGLVAAMATVDGPR